MEQCLIIEGGRPLEGTVRVHGAKNAALPLMAASLVVEGPVVLHGVPRLRDVATIEAILRSLGVDVEWVGPASVRLQAPAEGPVEPPADLVRRMRASVCVLGPLLARRGEARLPSPGGCVLGPRPIDLHLKGLRALGAEVEEADDLIRARAAGLQGGRVCLRGPRGSTVLGTANVLMAAVLAEGCTVIEGAAREPEVQDLAHFLSRAGAKISGIGTSRLRVRGVRRLRGCQYRIIPDRIEAGTYLAAAAATGGCVTVEGVRPDHMQATLDALTRMGAALTIEEHAIRLTGRRPLRAISLATAPYPGLPTDMQPQLGALLCLAEGTGRVYDNIYPERFTHLPGLLAMGARVVREGRCATFTGPVRLRGARVHAPDLRAGAALVIAALAAEGRTVVSGLEQIDRGYQDLEANLRALGAEARRQPVPEAAARRKSA